MKMHPLLALALLALLPGTAGALADPHFGPRTDFPTGTAPAYVAIGDLNGDGIPDLAVANSGAHTVSILLGTGNGSFGTRTDISTGGTPTFVAIADLNADGKRDLVVVNSTGNVVSVLLGNGNGTFGPATSYPTGNYPVSVAIGNLNADGFPDLAVANFYSQSVSVMLGNGNGTFRPRTDFDTGYMPVSVVIGDFDGNGWSDLALANRGSNTVSVLLGNGNGSFGANTEFPTGDYPGFMAIGDLNGDGNPDLAVANSNGNTVSVLLGNGRGDFAPRTDFAVGAYPWAAAIGDLNGDGWPDLAVANSSSNTVSVLPGYGDGTFGTRTDFATGSSPQSVAIADLNGDGRPDLVLPNLGSNTVSVLLGQPAPSATSLASSPNPSLVGQGVTLTAVVTPAGAGGSVTFLQDGAPIGSGTLAGGVATLPAKGLCGGSYSFTAVYGGDPGHFGSTSPALVHAVNPAPTAVAVVSSLNPSRLAQPLSFTATVSDSSGSSCEFTGSVQFLIDGVPFGAPVTVSGRTARIGGITNLAAGPHSVVAIYSGNGSFAGSTSPAVTQQVELPKPALVGVRDAANDQGGHVKLLWNASYLDLAPYDSIAAYWVYRSAPPAVAAKARASHVGEPAEPRTGSLLAVPQNGTTYYWEFIASMPAFHVPNYSYVAQTTRDSVAGSNPFTSFMVMARSASGVGNWYSDPDSGYSVDNLAPVMPAQFTGTYASGVAILHWAGNAEADLAQYRLYRGATADFAPGPGSLVAATADTSYVDAAGVAYHYKLCAVDVHGNASGFAALLPAQAAGVGEGAALAFALEGVHPNPSRGEPLSVAFTLPTAAYARIELVDVSGRRVALREVGGLGAGRHSVTLAGDGRLAPGLYMVRLTQGANVFVTRAAVLK